MSLEHARVKERNITPPPKEIQTPLRSCHERIINILFLREQFWQLYKDQVLHGFLPKRSIVTNAKQHKDAGTVIRLDIRHAFDSTKRQGVLVKLKKLEFPQDLVEFITLNCFRNESLPQGYSTSPDLFNTFFLDLDTYLAKASQKLGFCKYTRYADDLFFSTETNITNISGDNISYLRRIIESYGYETHDLIIGHPLSRPITLCGVSIYKGRLFLPGKTKDRIRAALHQALVSTNPPNINRARGFFAYVTMVEGKIPPVLKKYHRILKSSHP